MKFERDEHAKEKVRLEREIARKIETRYKKRLEALQAKISHLETELGHRARDASDMEVIEKENQRLLKKVDFQEAKLNLQEDVIGKL